MGRSIEEIQTSILLKKKEAETLTALKVLTVSEKQSLTNLNSTSKASIWRLWVFIQSFAIYVHEQIFDVHKKEIESLIELNKIHGRQWYKKKALDFQFGFDLAYESDQYDNEGIEESVVLASKIVKHVSMQEQAGQLIIKVAKGLEGEELEPLTEEELTAFNHYMQLVKDAGTYLRSLSRNADSLQLYVDVYYNPLVLNSVGQRLDGTNDTPVTEGVKTFLRNIEFSGELTITELTDWLQGIEGVELPVITEARCRAGLNVHLPINETYVPDAGYIQLDESSTFITYIAREIV